MNTYEPVIGLEVHVQLGTRSKAFCGCSTEFGAKPNSHVCPVCLGLPGSLPVLNKAAFNFAIKVGLALNCQVQEYTKFDRKHYYYPDLPKNYQISQYDLPVSLGGFLEIDLEGQVRRIGITRVHLEEDAGKLIHKDDASLVDLNRAGIPLLEVVSDPDIHSAPEAYEYLSSLKSIVKYLDVSDCDMEKGSLRCDANVSVRPKGQTTLGVKTELKNMNSFKGVKDALEFEIKRQVSVLEDGGSIIQETRLWDAQAGKT
ncbi:MAG: Asp-tRNA(Asn)/Glu-tRNA(Gln) amidotransferase subunit GatB, partial [Candidatus Omnitrophota bacterium]|nr:Asp-tRNA(Asn)/Glu-tRNA(Gln) amidotransferase subunit GatB [Candidatus Omnitrophota bacterium]